MAFLLLAATSLVVFYCLNNLAALFKNYRIAKTVGVPIVISPISPHNGLWLALQSFLRRPLQSLPFGLGSFVRYNRQGWNYNDKFKMHAEHGKIFIHVTPGGNEMFVADAAASDQILSRRKDFLKPIDMLESVDLFGKSLASVDGADWQRHRRITAPPFNERNSGLVWCESMRQAVQMLQYWTSHDKKSIPHDTARLALHVLTGAGFGMTYQFRGSLDVPGKGFRFTYRDALDIAMSDVILLMVVPKIVYSLPSGCLPEKLGKYKAAVDEFKRYLVDMVDAAKARAVLGEPAHPDLLNTLVQKSQEADQDLKSEAQGKNGLSDEEIYGNLFMFSFAGHETTANALAYSVYLFAAFPEMQEWVAEEVREVLAGQESIETLEYEVLFPRLKRCFAVMLETLRLYSPVLFVPKCTDSPASLKFEGREITVPPKTHVFPNIVALQTNPEYWGQDALDWKPTRWISRPGSKADLDQEELITPVKGSYIPWADGPRICPGKKFSQVEFVAVIAVLLWRHRVEVVPKGGESREEARKRVWEVVEDSGTKFTLQMRRPESVELRFVEG
ncbi:cytochrome P450 monooxygenase-like protein [Halenospora varia]|nr:cytochrome P450 monooxygenase-like protein [Halenospora varia]